MTDYNQYMLSRAQWISAIIVGCATCYVAAWVMTREPVVSAVCAAAGLLYPRLYRKRLCARRRNKLRLAFKEMLQVLSSMLSAGRSVENAFLSLESDLALVLADPRSDLLLELRVIANRLRNGEPLEKQLLNLADRSKLEEIRYFSDAIAVCKRAGGDLVDIVRSTSQLLGEKLDVELELSVLMAQKRFESRIMMVMPFALIGMLGWMSPEYLAPLRQGIGWVVLTICMVFLGLICWWMDRIMKVEV